MHKQRIAEYKADLSNLWDELDNLCTRLQEEAEGLWLDVLTARNNIGNALDEVQRIERLSE